MRLGIIADVHGNRHALTAVLQRLDAEHVDRLVVAGDLVGWGPFPNTCVELVAARDAHVVAGNHELIVLDRLGDQRCSALARRTQRWTREVLRDDVRAYLGRLPSVLEVGPAVVAHGSPDDPEEYVRSDRRAHELLERLGRHHPGARYLVLGHTHSPWVHCARRGTVATAAPADERAEDAPVLVNPGSVGQSRRREREPLARYAVLDTDSGAIRLRQVAYDWRAARAAAAARGLPPEATHAPPHSLPRLARRVRDRLVGAAEVR